MSKPDTRLLVLSLLPLALAGAILGLAWLQWNNTLLRNGRWTPTKTTMERQLLGAHSYWEGRQTLAGGMLSLGAWHGFQEVLTTDAMDLDLFEIEFFLTKTSYVTAMVYDATGERYSGVRLSLNKRFPNAALTGSGDGEITEIQPLRPPMKTGVTQRLRLEIEGSEASIALDGADVGRLALPGPGPYRVGFRGGWSNAYIHEAVLSDGSNTTRETFGPFRHAGVVVPLFAGGAFGVGLLLLVLVSLVRRVPATTLAAYAAMMGTTLLLMFGLLWAAAFHLTREPHYPSATSGLGKREQATRRRHLKTRRKAVLSSHDKERSDGTIRIFFLGTSQTWGAGARRASETIPPQVESLLESNNPGRDFECINGGVSSVTAPMLARVWERSWIDLDPDVLVIDLGNNDRDGVAFASAMDRIVSSALERDIQVALVQEPNTPERQDRALIANHRALHQIAKRYEVAIVPMHTYLAAKSSAGFLWWDKVHLTSFGQRLFAERLVETLEEELVEQGDERTTEAVGSSAGVARVHEMDPEAASGLLQLDPGEPGPAQ